MENLALVSSPKMVLVCSANAKDIASTIRYSFGLPQLFRMPRRSSLNKPPATTFVSALSQSHPTRARPPLRLPKTNDAVCKGVECGKGTCKPATNSAFLFECQCDPGWKQTGYALDNNLRFLPCVIPDCTLDYSCMEAAPSVQDKESQADTSVFDPCHWTDCGGGKCNTISPFTYSCECSQNYYNLLDMTALPCFRECALGMDCSGLGINVMNKSTSRTRSLPDYGTNQASLISQGIVNWLIIVMMVLAPLIVWK